MENPVAGVAAKHGPHLALTAPERNVAATRRLKRRWQAQNEFVLAVCSKALSFNRPMSETGRLLVLPVPIALPRPAVRGGRRVSWRSRTPGPGHFLPSATVSFAAARRPEEVRSCGSLNDDPMGEAGADVFS